MSRPSLEAARPLVKKQVREHLTTCCLHPCLLKGTDLRAHPQEASIFGTPLAEQAPGWSELQWLRARTRLPLVVKGVLHPATAQQAVAAGADALIVSNHGGRVLDGVVSPIEVLPQIAEAMQVPLLLGSGLRWGTDVVKALGASAVLVGRPQLHALACAGWLGVAHMLHLLRAELELSMAQLGCPTLDALSPQMLWPPGAGSPG